MNPVVLEDIMGLAAYERVRQQYRQKIIALKEKRRIPVGDKVSLVFENRETVIFQIQEMLRAERISDLERIREELATYNELIPSPGELSATLFVEIENQENLRQELLNFFGIDETVSFKIGDHSVPARYEEDRSREDKISAVQYVKFRFSPQAIQAFTNGERVELTIDHENYRSTACLNRESQESLAQDFAN
jgi:hypothetical protein